MTLFSFLSVSSLLVCVTCWSLHFPFLLVTEYSIAVVVAVVIVRAAHYSHHGPLIMYIYNRSVDNIIYIFLCTQFEEKKNS